MRQEGFMPEARGCGVREDRPGPIGLVRELVVGKRAETLPILIFSLLVIQGIVIIWRKGQP